MIGFSIQRPTERTHVPCLPTGTPEPQVNISDVLPHRALPENRGSCLLFWFLFFFLLWRNKDIEENLSVQAGGLYWGSWSWQLPSLLCFKQKPEVKPFQKQRHLPGIQVLTANGLSLHSRAAKSTGFDVTLSLGWTLIFFIVDRLKKKKAATFCFSLYPSPLPSDSVA